MANKNYLQFVASFLIMLVFTIPFYTTSVYASINNVSVKGSDGIEGFAKSTDFLNINVQSSISGDTVTNDQLVLGSSTQFDKCTASINNGSECTLRVPSNGTEQFEAKSVPFSISLFRDDKSLDDSKSSIVTIDAKAPQVKLSMASKSSSQQDVVIEYDVTDFACDDSSCSGKCVGIKSIDLYTKDNAFKQSVTPATGNCNVKSSIRIDSKIFNDGKNSIFAKATDKFNQVSPETSVTFSLDANGPQIISNSFEILRKGVAISTFSPTGIDVDVAVNISADDLDLNSVRADLSGLNPSQNLKNAKASCSAVEDGIFSCKWGIELDPGAAGQKTIAINASDSSGNKESATITKFLSIDDKGPVVLSLSTGTEKEGQPLGKASGNTIIATFEEATGLAPEDVFLIVDDRKIKATSCGKEGSWICAWDNVNFGRASRVSVDSASLDILGIDAAGDIFLDVSVDINAPVVRTINISNIGGLVPAFSGFAKIGDKIAVVANVTEDNNVFAAADFSSFISGASNVAGSCERLQADEHVCTWLTDSINLASSGTIEFNFSDDAGNTLILTRSFKTFGLENATVPDFWNNIVGCSPSTIDRELGPLINQRVYCQIVLRPKSASKAVSTVFIVPATCSGNGSSIVQNVETFNTEVGSTSPVIKITLKKDDFKINNADLSCSFNIFSKIGSSTTITKNPEIENAKVSLAFFNNPLGELGKEVQDKIKEAKEDAEGIWELIGVLNKVVYYAKKICSLINTIYNIVSVLWTFAIILNLVSTTAGKIPILGVSFEAAGQGACGTETSYRVVAQNTNQGLNWACSYVNCKQTILWGPTVKNFINNELPLILSPGQYVGSKTELDKSGSVKPIEVKGTDDKPLTLGRPISEYMDPQKNLIVATLFACLPGIIYGLDKYRQIKCLYADCLKNAVGKEGLPVTACEDQKAFATCKYITSELFAVFPWTVVFDHFMGLIKNALSNPFTALGPLISLACGYTCSIPEGITRTTAYQACEAFRLFGQIGSIASDVKSIIDEGFTIRTDYCDRLEDDDKDKKTPAATTTTAKK